MQLADITYEHRHVHPMTIKRIKEDGNIPLYFVASYNGDILMCQTPPTLQFNKAIGRLAWHQPGSKPEHWDFAAIGKCYTQNWEEIQTTFFDVKSRDEVMEMLGWKP